MTKTIKINCTYAWYSVYVLVWMTATGGSLFAVMVQSVTLDSFGDQTDCHITYFENKQVCLSKDNNIFYHVMTKEETIGWQQNFIILTVIFQIATFLIFNAWKGWIKIECVQKTKPSSLKDGSETL